MKKVVFSVEANLVGIDTITDSSIVGIQFGIKKAFVIETDWNKFVGMSFDNLSMRSKWSETSKRGYVQEAMVDGTPYIFDTPEELATWLAK
jgi:hypothetical protein